LPHSQLGEVQLSAYQTLLTALNTQKHSDAENIIIGFGHKMTPCADAPLTVGGEINKLAFNIPMARN
jgi:hypothetical protein